MAKLRIGLISNNRDDVNKLKEVNKDLVIHHSKNILELNQIIGSNKLDSIIYIDEGTLQKEFHSFHTFMRSKANLAKVPVGLFSKEPLRFNKVIADPMVRTYSTVAGLFLPLMNFLSAIQNPEALAQIITIDKIIFQLETALNQKIGQNTTFQHREANSDETHSSFFCQLSDEISTNLIWIKLSARILNDNSAGLRDLYRSLSENEIEETSENLLNIALKDFKESIDLYLKDAGAVAFPSSDLLPSQEKLPYIKKAKSTTYVLSSNMCSVLLEVIRYI